MCDWKIWILDQAERENKKGGNHDQSKNKDSDEEQSTDNSGVDGDYSNEEGNTSEMNDSENSDDYETFEEYSEKYVKDLICASVQYILVLVIMYIFSKISISII